MSSRLSRALVTVAVTVVAMGLYAIGVYAHVLVPKPKTLPVMGHVPEMQLVDQKGAPFTAATLHGHPWIADFIFTSCHSSCPELTAKMRRLQDVIAKGDGDARSVRLVSFSVDPEIDTPPVLSAYAAAAGADPAIWSFVTGPSDAMRAAVVGGFKMTEEREDKGAGVYDVVHGNWFVLGDGEGNIRGYYSTETDDDIAALARDAAGLARNPS